MKFSSKDWNIFLNLFRQSNVHLFLRIINLNLKIIVNDQCETEEDVTTSAGMSSFFESNAEKNQKLNIKSELSQTKEANDYKTDSKYSSGDTSNFISLRSLNDCIEKVTLNSDLKHVSINIIKRELII